MLFGMPRNEAQTVTPVIESACDYHNSIIIVLVSADNVTDMM